MTCADRNRMLILFSLLMSLLNCGSTGNSESDAGNDAPSDGRVRKGSTADVSVQIDGSVDGSEFSDSDSSIATDGTTSGSCDSGCAIDGSCYPDGVRNPMNDCEICDVSRSTSTWSDNDGQRCDDGLFCSVDDLCFAGSCGGTARDCSDSVACNGIETCNETDDVCATGTPTCTSSELCDVGIDSCVTTCSGCVIGGVCYGNGQRNPTNDCEVCNASTSSTSWSNNDGASCDDGAFCTVSDTCSGGTCSGTARSCDDSVACNGTETCNESTDSCDSGTTTCNTDEVCNVATDQCVTSCTGCVIGGVCYGNGQRNPTNDCEVCNASTSSTSWSNNDGASCDDGAFCTVSDTCSGGTCSGTARSCDDSVACNGTETCNESTDSCDSGTTTCNTDEVCNVATDQCVTSCTGCVIGGVCYGNGQRNPTNDCEVCNASTSSTSWSNNDGASCDDGAFCTVSDTCSGGTCSGTARSCDDSVACNGTETCNESTDSCDSGTTTCNADEVCDVVTDQCREICSGSTTVTIPFSSTSGWSSSACCSESHYRVANGSGATLTATFSDVVPSGRVATAIEVQAGIRHACDNASNAMDFQLNGVSMGTWGKSDGPHCACSNSAVATATFSPAVSSYLGSGATNTISIVHNANGSCHEAITTVPSQTDGTAFVVTVTYDCP